MTIVVKQVNYTEYSESYVMQVTYCCKELAQNGYQFAVHSTGKVTIRGYDYGISYCPYCGTPVTKELIQEESYD